jgi:hypothetical protein
MGGLRRALNKNTNKATSKFGQSYKRQKYGGPSSLDAANIVKNQANLKLIHLKEDEQNMETKHVKFIYK